MTPLFEAPFLSTRSTQPVRGLSTTEQVESRLDLLILKDNRLPRIVMDVFHIEQKRYSKRGMSVRRTVILRVWSFAVLCCALAMPLGFMIHSSHTHALLNPGYFHGASFFQPVPQCSTFFTSRHCHRRVVSNLHHSSFFAANSDAR